MRFAQFLCETPVLQKHWSLKNEESIPISFPREWNFDHVTAYLPAPRQDLLNLPLQWRLPWCNAHQSHAAAALSDSGPLCSGDELIPMCQLREIPRVLTPVARRQLQTDTLGHDLDVFPGSEVQQHLYPLDSRNKRTPVLVLLEMDHDHRVHDHRCLDNRQPTSST